MESPDRVLVTAGYGFKDVEDLAKIEFRRRNRPGEFISARRVPTPVQ